MSVAWTLITDLEARGGRLEETGGGDLRVIAPRGLLKPEEVETLRAQKPWVLAWLRSWPRESADYVQRFGREEARLYPLLGRRVSTLHHGPGLLVSVSAERAAVVLDRTPGRCVFLPWREVGPAMEREDHAAA